MLFASFILMFIFDVSSFIPKAAVLQRVHCPTDNILDSRKSDISLLGILVLLSSNPYGNTMSETPHLTDGKQRFRVFRSLPQGI